MFSTREHATHQILHEFWEKVRKAEENDNASHVKTLSCTQSIELHKKGVKPKERLVGQQIDSKPPLVWGIKNSMHKTKNSNSINSELSSLFDKKFQPELTNQI